MNIFERPIVKEYVGEYIDDLDEDEYEYGWDEDFDELPDVIYQNDTVRISHLSGINIVECVFLQDDVNVYLTFINTDISENCLQKTLTAVTQSDADCVEKFDSICELIFQKKFDRTIEDVDECKFYLQSSVKSVVEEGLSRKSSEIEFAANFGFYFNNIKAHICFFKENDIMPIRDNAKVIELANRIIPYEEKFEYCFNKLKGLK